MNTKHQILKINKPCLQGWENMYNYENGKFCKNCNKTVIDFTALNDNQIKSILDKSSGKVCGRFYTSQLNRQLEIKKDSSINYFHKIFLGFSLTTIFTNTISSKNIIKPSINLYSSNDKLIKNNHETPTDTISLITCKIVDSTTKKPIAFATVLINDLDLKLSADTNGIFKINIPVNFKKTNIQVKIFYIGYNEKVVNIDLTEKKTFIETSITEMQNFLLGDVCVYRPSFFQRVKNKFKRKNKSNH